MPKASDVREDYRSAGFGNLIGWGKRPALLIVDMCRAYFQAGSPLLLPPSSGDVPGACRKLLHAARDGSVPVVWTQVKWHKSMMDAGVFYLKVKEPLEAFLTPYGEELDELKSSEDELVIHKQYPSAFFGTSLASTLTSLGVDTLVVCGVSTSGCVRASTLDALQHGFRPMVVEAACGERTPEIQAANIFDIGSKMADIVGLDEAVERLSVGWQGIKIYHGGSQQ